MSQFKRFLFNSDQLIGIKDLSPIFLGAFKVNDFGGNVSAFIVPIKKHLQILLRKCLIISVGPSGLEPGTP